MGLLVALAACTTSHVPPAPPLNPAREQPAVLCDDPRLPPIGGQPYCVSQNQGAAPYRFPPLVPIDFDGSCPSCSFALWALPDGGVEYTVRGTLSPYEGKKEVDFDLFRAIPDRPNGLVGFVTHYDRLEVSGLHGNVTVAPAIWFRATGDTRTCVNPHSWLSVMLPPMHPLVTPVSADVIYRSRNSASCGQIYIFNATGPTIHWRPGQPLDIEWGRLVELVHARGWWPSIRAADAHAVTQFAGQLAGYTPGGAPAPAAGQPTGGATVRLWGWREGR